MGVILDTSLLIGAERGTIRFEAFLEPLGDEPVGIAAITAAELLHGCHRAKDSGVRARRAAFVEAVLELMPTIPFGLPEARRHAELWAELARGGTLISPYDMLIAATALASGWGIATLNTGEFKRVAGLRLVPLTRFVS